MGTTHDLLLPRASQLAIVYTKFPHENRKLNYISIRQLSMQYKPLHRSGGNFTRICHSPLRELNVPPGSDHPIDEAHQEYSLIYAPKQ